MEIRKHHYLLRRSQSKRISKQESDLQGRLDEIDKSISNSCDNQNLEDKLKEFDKLKNQGQRRNISLQSEMDWIWWKANQILF